ncbi:hypothetical protein [Nocardia sp. NBC_01009]|uniref:hypothetical protein n=1 Tax=Nocardia sp. NBC_01009 TaxID=2975996 RepID=UPI0038697B82|nr:hypothetical protein OHA42_05040 [Nocardia sp. NBC_01009]
MPLDRTVEPVDDSAPWHSPDCRDGWLGYDRQGRLIPCLVCRDHLINRSTINDFAEREPSALARAAIERDNRNA